MDLSYKKNKKKNVLHSYPIWEFMRELNFFFSLLMRIGIPRLPPLTPSSDSLSSSSPYHHLHNISHDLWPEGQSPCQLKLISLWSLVTARKHESHQRGGFFFFNSVWFLHVKTYLCLLLGVDILLSKKIKWKYESGHFMVYVSADRDVRRAINNSRGLG